MRALSRGDRPLWCRRPACFGREVQASRLYHNASRQRALSRLTALPRALRRAVVAFALCGGATGLAGCAAPGPEVSLADWQSAVEEYVWEEAAGDPAALRDLESAPGRRGFALFSDPDPARSTDARGVLVAHRTVAGRPWFVFLVGLVGQGAVRDVRPAAFSAPAGEFEWVVGEPNGQSLAAYLARATTGGFPAAGDAFELTADENRVTIVERVSGARWGLTLPAPTGSAPAPLSPARASGGQPPPG